MRSHFSAFLRILSNVNTRARVIYATYFRNATYMQHIRGIFRRIPHIFRAYFAPKRPAYFKKNFRYKPVSLTTQRQLMVWVVWLRRAIGRHGRFDFRIDFRIESILEASQVPSKLGLRAQGNTDQRHPVGKYGVSAGWCRSYPSRDKTARFLTADVEQLIRDGTAEKEHLSTELKLKLKLVNDAATSVRKSSQVGVDVIA